MHAQQNTNEWKWTTNIPYRKPMMKHMPKTRRGQPSTSPAQAKPKPKPKVQPKASSPPASSQQNHKQGQGQVQVQGQVWRGGMAYQPNYNGQNPVAAWHGQAQQLGFGSNPNIGYNQQFKQPQQQQQTHNAWQQRAQQQQHPIIRRVLQTAMTPKQFASWIGSADLMMSLIGPCRDLWARYDLLIRGFARIHCVDSGASRDVINIILRNFVEYPDAATANCVGAILVFLAGQDELKQTHVERLWSAIVAPMQHSERRSDTELSSWNFSTSRDKSESALAAVAVHVLNEVSQFLNAQLTSFIVERIESTDLDALAKLLGNDPLLLQLAGFKRINLADTTSTGQDTGEATG